VRRRLATTTLTIVVVALLGACGEGSNRQVASNAKADRQIPGGETKTTHRAKPKPTTTAPAAAAAPKATVSIKDDLFAQTQVEVTAGDAVQWKWEGKNPHNVDGPGFKSKIQTSGTFTKTFEKPGTFDYRCDVHPTMKASVVVTG
jgi:plastocyanin